MNALRRATSIINVMSARSSTEEADRLEADAHDLIARGHAMLAQAARLRASRSVPCDTATPVRPTPLVDVRDCAYALGVSSATIHRLVRSGRVPFVVVGQSKRFDLAAVREALEHSMVTEKQLVVPTPQASATIPGVRLLSRRKGAGRVRTKQKSPS
jgi:excisionase family DNA binding protein